MTIDVYVLKTCDTCRKALAWMDQNGLAYRSIDVRTDGVPTDVLELALAHIGADKLVNKSSTTWRDLDASIKDGLNPASAATLISQHPTLMKRPLFRFGDTFVCGFRDDQKAFLLSQTDSR